MAKYRNINHSELERAHFLRIERYAKLVDQIYQEAIKEFSQLAKTINFDPKKPFSFKDYPKTLNTANQLFKKLSDSVQLTIANGNKEEWLHAAKNNDQLVNSILGNSRIEKKLLEKYMDRNLEALEAFQKRKIAGMGLSDRVWNQTQQFQKEIEMGLDLGLGEGKSASSLSRDLRSNLNEPERLFRRVRDKHGILHLSKNAEAYNPGQGVYRSSYKNALRLTRTETNMAYRESDYHRWQQLDFIVGIEIRLSNNPNHCPMCEALAGKYPKDFKFVGWHPQCRCRMISILKTDEELEDDIALILNDITPENVSENGITSMPKGYTDWMSKNDERIKLAKSTPYFIRDNYKGGDVKKGLRFEVSETIQPVLPKNFDKYQSELEISVDNSIFSHLEKPVDFKMIPGEGAYFDPNENFVNIPIDKARLESKWKAESVVYHEYGHAIDWQRNLRDNSEVKKMMYQYRKAWGKDDFKIFSELDEKLWKEGRSAYLEGRKDEMHQIGAISDTLMALNKNFGAGHSKQYFSIPGFPEAEFLAHAFENKFAGNPMFKKLVPDLYNDMIKLINQLLGIKQA